MNDERRAPDEDAQIISPDTQLLELIEFVWTCEVAARREDRLDAAIRCGRGRASR